ncbi:uncharacterized protein LOC110808494 [Carica papaya]|uniref:uncharacterized protein LOC110808494 n=1 Tax=Carica papaya TaxID=3649 RepID=UPI000B8CC0FE|nr:uncharacterized protein LOC110808494 [Carica papaya]
MVKNWLLFLLIFLFLSSGFSSVSAAPTPPVKILSGLVSNVVSVVWKWFWSLQSTTIKSAVSSPSMMKFESGYTVETVFDGSKLGIEPYSVEVSPTGGLLVLDSKNSNVYKISMPLSKYSRPKLFAGSPEGYSGHVDGKIREARMYHPKGLTVDDRGNVYIADTMNMAIRKVSDAGVTTIAGGKWGKGVGHVDGPSEDAKFSDDFDVIYIRSSCSILIVDRGNQAIREIQLNDEDCSYEFDGNFHLGIAVLVAAGFFGYMLALLQRRVQALFSSQDDLRAPTKKRMRMASYQRPSKSINYNGWDGDHHRQQQLQRHHQLQMQHHHHRHYSSNPQTYYEKSCETNEIVFGAVQEQDGRREAVVIKAVDYGDHIYNRHDTRPRLNYMGYAHSCCRSMVMNDGWAFMVENRQMRSRKRSRRHRFTKNWKL